MNFLKAVAALFVRVPRRRPRDATGALRSGRAILVDVRERGEWRNGVAEGAVPLPLSDLMGKRDAWTRFLADVGDRELVLYCKAGGRSAIAAKILRKEGFNAADGGALREWTSAGWSLEKPGSSRR